VGRLRGTAPGRSAPSANLGPLISQKLLELKKLKNYIHLERVKYSFFDIKNVPLGASEGHSAKYCKFRTPHISETIRVKKLNFTHT